MAVYLVTYQVFRGDDFHPQWEAKSDKFHADTDDEARERVTNMRVQAIEVELFRRIDLRWGIDAVSAGGC